MEGKVQERPELLSDSSESVMFDLIEVEDPQLVLQNDSAQIHSLPKGRLTSTSSAEKESATIVLVSMVVTERAVEIDRITPMTPSPMIIRVSSPTLSTRFVCR